MYRSISHISLSSFTWVPSSNCLKSYSISLWRRGLSLNTCSISDLKFTVITFKYIIKSRSNTDRFCSNCNFNEISKGRTCSSIVRFSSYLSIQQTTQTLLNTVFLDSNTSAGRSSSSARVRFPTFNSFEHSTAKVSFTRFKAGDSKSLVRLANSSLSTKGPNTFWHNLHETCNFDSSSNCSKMRRYIRFRALLNYSNPFPILDFSLLSTSEIDVYNSCSILFLHHRIVQITI